MACELRSADCGVRNQSAAVNEIVIFSIGARSAVSIPGEENFILAKNLPLDATNPGSSLLSLDEQEQVSVLTFDTVHRSRSASRGVLRPSWNLRLQVRFGF